jgi:hypothetical protein|tara:strand:- start:2780 stop:2881 length:102 start_codon:yes stop_codon:yes gene_type:complete
MISRDGVLFLMVKNKTKFNFLVNGVNYENKKIC